MANKYLEFNGEKIPLINDGAMSSHPDRDTYSRQKIDSMVSAGSNGYDWSDRVVSIEGDSHVANATTGFPRHLSDALGVKTSLIAISGVPVYGSYQGDSKDFRRRVSNIPANVDLIIVSGDSNAISTDVSHLNSDDISTWGGRWNVAVNAIKKSFPQVPLLLVSDYPHRDLNMDRTWHTFEQFERMAVRHGAYHVSIAKDGGFSRLYTTHVWGLYDGDTSGHCSHDAMKIWSDCVIQKIRSIRPPIWTGVDDITIPSSCSVQVNGTADVEYTVTGDQSVQWTSSNMDVACVMGGTVYGMSSGQAVITAKTRSGKTATCTVTVVS